MKTWTFIVHGLFIVNVIIIIIIIIIIITLQPKSVTIGEVT